MSKQPPPAPTASAVGPYPTIIQIEGRPGTGSLPRTIAPPDHPLFFVSIVIKSCTCSPSSAFFIESNTATVSLPKLYCNRFVAETVYVLSPSKNFSL